jgi:hypothetical protein
MPMLSQDERALLIVLLAIAPTLIFAVVGFILIKFSKRIAARLTSDLESSTPAPSNIDHVQSILISIVGILLMALALRPLFVEIVQLVSLSQTTFSDDLIPEKAIKDSWIRLASQLMQFLLGLVLIFQARSITSLWNKLRKWTPSDKSGGRT